MRRRRRRTVRGRVEITSARSNRQTKPAIIKVRLICPACHWRDRSPVRLEGQTFGCPRCDTKVFSWNGRPVYLHGGQRGLSVGSLLLPPEATGATGSIREYAIKSGLIQGREDICRSDRVYLTTRWDAAVMYAVHHPSLGQVYMAQPHGPVDPDPDCNEGGISYQVRSATILKAMDVSPGEIMAVIQTLKRYGVSWSPSAEVENGQGTEQAKQREKAETREAALTASG